MSNARVKIVAKATGTERRDSQLVLDTDYCAPSFTCMGGGGKTPKIIMNKKLMETLRENELGEDVKALDLYNKKAQDNLPTLMLPNHNSIALWNGYAVRKLTPRECFRLMGVRDEDFDKIKDKFSDSTLYHLAGDSIVTTVLMAVLAPMFDKEEKFDYREKENERTERHCKA